MKDIVLFSLLLSVFFICIILYLVKKKLLQEKYSLLWLFFGLMMIVLSTNFQLLDIVAKIMDVQYPPALLFFIGILVCLILILHLTVVVSKQAELTIRLIQEVGLLKLEIEKQSTGAGNDA